jgi:hypothetical protein
MPNVFILPRPDVAEAFTPVVFRKVAKKMRKAVADSHDLSMDAVAVYRLPVEDVEGGVNGLQILCLASHTDERIKLLPLLRDTIANAMIELEKEDEECAAFFKLAGTGDSWPIMPFGLWKEVEFGK